MNHASHQGGNISWLYSTGYNTKEYIGGIYVAIVWHVSVRLRALVMFILSGPGH